MLETERLFLRPTVEADEASLYAILSDAETMAFWPAPFSLEQTQYWIKRSINSWAENGVGRFMVIRKEDDVLLGDCGIFFVELDGAVRADLGYILYATFWNNGYATEAANAVLNWGLKTKNISEVFANMAEEHIASRKVAEKIGMVYLRSFHNPKNRNFLTRLYVAQSIE